MKTFEIIGSKREGLGKAATKKVRNAGNVPCNLYGDGVPVNISVEHNALKKMLFTPETYLVDINLDGKVTRAVVKEAQYHPVFDNVLHVDFLRVAENKPIEVELPVTLSGSAKGSFEGGKLQLLSRRLKVRGLAAKLPASIVVDVTELGLGKTILVDDLKVEGVEFTSPGKQGVATVAIPRSAKEELAATPAAAPAAAPAAKAPAAKK